ncbi:MAG: glycosyltransferase family 4 protein [Lacrimispora sp.]|uniref:glycosyltransferase family 4 protein n=1 Tax=Lacrimispora sp. TaxID=2719234 RepID=UPI0039E5DDFD
MGNKKKVLFLVNHDIVIYNFRKELVEYLIDDGHEVYISSPFGGKIDLLIEMGCKYIETNINRHGTNPIQDIKLIMHYKNIIKDIKPEVVLTYTIKPNIYGGIVCRMLNVPYISNITGLGGAIENEGLTKWISLQLYRIGLKKAKCVFFQNQANRKFMIDNYVTTAKERLIPGSGVNINEFSYKEYPKDTQSFKFLFVGRIMRDKGIEELAEAAKVIKKEYANVQFDALGFCETEYEERIQLLQKENIITFHGVKDNIRSYLENCSAIIHPTYHEGMSNVLLEAAATGRPILASNISGCKEIFDEGVSGFSFEVKDVESLISSISKFMRLSVEEREVMGIEARKKVTKEFDRQIIVNAYLDEIDAIIKGNIK